MTYRLLTSVALSLTACLGFSTFASAQSSSEDITRQCERPKGQGPSLYVWDADNLNRSRALIQAGDSRVTPAYEALLAAADKALTLDPLSPTNKLKTPPSGDKRDYYSIGPYWWPNPKKSDGLPYVRRDGETNPERYDDSFDSARLSKFSRAVASLSLAAYFSENRAYGDKAADLVRTWFLEPTKRMNPNMNFAQAIPGKVDGRGIGIIDSYGFVRVIDSIGILYEMGALSDAELDGLKSWFADYSLWMLTSDNGKDERAALNNHGTFYDAQLMTFSAFTGDMRAVKFVADGIKSSRIPGQINKKGQLPLELKRSRPFHYTAYTINGFFDAADVAECIGEDLWNYETPRGQSLVSAAKYQAKYANKLSSWPFKEIRTISPRGFHKNMRRAQQAYDAPEFKRAVAVHADKYATDIATLLYPPE